MPAQDKKMTPKTPSPGLPVAHFLIPWGRGFGVKICNHQLKVSKIYG